MPAHGSPARKRGGGGRWRLRGGRPRTRRAHKTLGHIKAPTGGEGAAPEARGRGGGRGLRRRQRAESTRCRRPIGQRGRGGGGRWRLRGGRPRTRRAHDAHTKRRKEIRESAARTSEPTGRAPEHGHPEGANGRRRRGGSRPPAARGAGAGSPQRRGALLCPERSGGQKGKVTTALVFP